MRDFCHFWLYGRERSIAPSWIADVIRREYNVSDHHGTIAFLLRDLGFPWQKPACRMRERGKETGGGAGGGTGGGNGAGERDEIRVESWRREVWPELKKSIAGSGVILAADEVGFMQMPSVKKTAPRNLKSPGHRSARRR